MESFVRFGRCFSDPSSLRVLNLLRHGELCKCEIDSALKGAPNFSAAVLKKLVLAGLVSERKRSLWTAYRLAPRHDGAVRAVFETFVEDVEWNPTVEHDERALAEALALRVDEWCKDPRDYGNYGQHKKKIKP